MLKFKYKSCQNTFKYHNEDETNNKKTFSNNKWNAGPMNEMNERKKCEYSMKLVGDGMNFEYNLNLKETNKAKTKTNKK